MAARYDFIIEQGATYNTQWYLSGEDGLPRDLTGFSVSAQFRPSYDSQTVYTFSAGVVDPATSGSFNLSYPASSSMALPASTYVHDIYLESGSGAGLYRERLAQGTITVDPQATTV
jgi:hypothetical protein